MERQAIFDQLRTQPEVDVLVIGGGINGISTFRELALQGVRVLLVERDDFCSGASAASSHMLHGGIRYLENAEFRLVQEALHERNRMLKNAPHYAKPLPTTIPIFKWATGLFNAPLKFLSIRDKPAERGAIVIKAGLTMYDRYTSRDQVMPTHDFDRRKASLKKYPKLNPEVVCTATYYDAWMPYPERICIELIQEAEQANPQAFALNYTPVTDGIDDTVIITDETSGKTYTIKPQVVVNAAGPWIDFVNKAMRENTNFIGGTKGSHLILDHPALFKACQGHEFFFENEDGRIVLIFPYMNRVMVGTTDIRIDNPDEAVCTDEEIDYIIGMIPRVFPSIKVDRSHIVYTFSGVRPLPSSEDNRTGTISRDHQIKSVTPDADVNFPIHALIGGKWTTFRAFGAKAADLVLNQIDVQRTISTEDRAFGGGKGYPQDPAVKEMFLRTLQTRTRIPLSRLQIGFERYGTSVKQLADYITTHPESDTPLEHLPDYTRYEIQYLTAAEKVVHLTDLIKRRSLIAMLGYATQPALQEIAEAMADTLGWDKNQIADEVARAIQDLHAKNRLDIVQAR